MHLTNIDKITFTKNLAKFSIATSDVSLTVIQLFNASFSLDFGILLPFDRNGSHHLGESAYQPIPVTDPRY